MLKEVDRHYVLQDNVTKQYLCTDLSWNISFSIYYERAKKFKDISEIDWFITLNKDNKIENEAYIEWFKGICKNIIPKLIIVKMKD